MGRVLIIDDEELFRQDLATLLQQEGHECQTAATGEEGMRVAEEFRPQVVLCDLVMPGMNGIQVVERLHALLPNCAPLMITAHATLDTAIESFRMGAVDLVIKPVVTERLLHVVERLLAHQRLEARVANMRTTMARHACCPSGLVGDSDAIRDVKDLIERVAPHDTAILITGESGTGKELVARAIHDAGDNRDGPFVAVNCAAVTDSLFESELFGHAKGAFTGAAAARLGFFEAAAGGTLLLDEVGEIPLDLQGKLLRAVERREIIRVGETHPVPVSGRILASTNRDLQTLIEEGQFRVDLFYRLRVVQIVIPPLRERRGDIQILADHFLHVYNQTMNLRCAAVSDEAMSVLMTHTWPGNVRELQNVIERALIVGDGKIIRATDLPSDIGQPSSIADDGDDLRGAMRQFELAHIRKVLSETDGNRAETARRLGIDASTLWRKLGGDEPSAASR